MWSLCTCGFYVHVVFMDFTLLTSMHGHPFFNGLHQLGYAAPIRVMFPFVHFVCL
mgnify:CR=1 FL=1